MVLFDVHDIGVIIGNPHLRIRIPLLQRHDDLKGNPIVHVLHRDLRIFQELLHPGDLFIGNLRDHLQLLICLSGYDPRRGCRRDSLQMIGIWHDHAFYIFNNTSAGLHLYFIRHGSQHLSCFCRRICQRDRLRTPHCRNQFFF